ncbi:MAG: hypothetical protein OEL87_03910, partial [Nanoarchaeota archaeon]|nr:hypothetical protein [Nanoarchaeota archaeon]
VITIVQKSANANEILNNLRILLKKENIDVQKTIKKFDSPVWSIFLYKFGEQPLREKEKLPKKLSEHITKNLNFEIIANSFYFLPPNKMPTIKEDFNIEKWTKKNIINKLPKKIPYNLKWVSLVDLRNVYAYKSTEYGDTVFDILLKKDRNFLDNLLLKADPRKINFKKISEDWKLVDIVTLEIDNKVFNKIKKENGSILEAINCKNVSEIGRVEKKYLKNKLQEILEEEVSEELIDNIRENSNAVSVFN